MQSTAIFSFCRGDFRPASWPAGLKRRHLLATAILTLVSVPAYAGGLPTGGQIVAGSGTISQTSNTMTVTQGSDKLVTNWQSFSIGKGDTVNFVQPSSSAVAFNRVLGSDVSVIQGALNANGRVFLVNPNGVLFTPNAQVNVGGLVASTLDMKTADFLAGNYTFAGDSSNAIINQGNIRAATNGTVALIAAKIVNEGTITADGGNILMGAGSKVTLDLGGPVKLEVDEGALQTEIDQGGALRANGGQIYLTAKAAGDLATSVINHTGVSEAETLATGEKGEIILAGDMDHGVTNVGGTLDAAAPSTGDGGFIETSAATVNVAQNTTITAGAHHGKGGEWLVDPYDYTIDATAAANIDNVLNTGTSVTISTATNNTSNGSSGNSAGNGNIKVSSAISKTAGGDAGLTLSAANVIEIAAPITSTSGKLDVLLDADSDRNGSGVIIASQNITTNGGDLNFGTGATISIGGVNTLVGGDLYVDGTTPVTFKTGGGDFNLYGEMLIANTGGTSVITNNGNAHFYGIINSGDTYQKMTAPGSTYFTWQQAFDAAKNGTAGGGAVGDQYLATVTSRLENSIVVYTGGFTTSGLSNGAWLGGERVTGIGTSDTWRWVAGPEGEEDNGNGLAFYNSGSGSAINGSFINWQSGEPNGGTGETGENKLQIGDTQGRWNDLVNDDGSIHLKIYIRETNVADSKLSVDAGTGTATYDQGVGGLKGIDVTSHDVNNPVPVDTPPTPPGPSVPQQVAIGTAQAVASATPAGQAGLSVPGGTNQNSQPQDSTNSSLTTVGSLQIVQVRSKGGTSTSGTSASGTSTSGTGDQANDQDNGQATETTDDSIDLADMDAESAASGVTKVFVIDGGMRLPDGTLQNNEQKELTVP
jgi:filamentous hemagglutinin family protein